MRFRASNGVIVEGADERIPLVTERFLDFSPSDRFIHKFIFGSFYTLTSVG